MAAFVNGISYYLPIHELKNEELSLEFPEWSVDKITKKTGIYSRHIAAADECVSDMALNALNKLILEYGISRSSIDYLILCTQSPDYQLPTTACIVQDRAGLSKNCGAIDFNLGCSGFVYGVGLAKGLIESGQAKNIVLITAETYTKIIHPKDKANRTLFGDAASATLITSEPNYDYHTAKILQLAYGTDGSGYDKLIVKNSGNKREDKKSFDFFDENEDFTSNEDYLFMNGREIFNFTAFEIPPFINKTLEKNEVEIDDISKFIFHQANAYMLEFLRKRCKIPEDKFYISIKDVGNTVSSTIPIAYNRLINEGGLQKGDKFLLCGFGVGLSMGAVILRTE